MGTPTKLPLNIFLDSDGPIADFKHDLDKSGMHPDDFKHVPGVYLWLPVTPGATEAIRYLKEQDDADRLRVWVLTKTPSHSPYAYTEKVLWYTRHFPWLVDRVILTHDKSVMGSKGDFLLDDRPHKANADQFPGTFVFFDESNPLGSWMAFTAKVHQEALKV